MRRDEFQITNEDDIKSVLNECEYGTLSLIAGSEPYGVAVNFVFFEGNIYFHGAKEGRKVDAIKTNPKASFLAVRPYSKIPSYFSNTRAACPATQFFASVHIYGNLIIIENAHDKAKILEEMMKKLQREGGYDKIEADNPMYTKMLEQTGVYALLPETISMKLKAGQNLTNEKKSSLVLQLRERGEDIDKKSASVIENYIM
ncbi:MAG: pyridoxamine 5'-phosphate oxidase family protein [Sulfurospirillaceae bacterium]|nr:pyridoxamine 5'-phosphate oxidase family protein [Sulfurospirillaceae bacterium]